MIVYAFFCDFSCEAYVAWLLAITLAASAPKRSSASICGVPFASSGGTPYMPSPDVSDRQFAERAYLESIEALFEAKTREVK